MTQLRLGFGLPVSGSWATRENLLEIARAAEAAGYESLWTFQRLLHPSEGEWGAMYHSVLDPLITLAHVAAVTDRARLGVAILNAPFFSPILLAKQVTTLDELSAGRVDTGLGSGWAEEEFVAVGVDRRRRGARVEEFVRCLRAIWTQDPVSFSGEFYQVPPAIVHPRPVQQPHPPILLGGDAEPALRRVGRLADGWITRSRHDLTKLPTDLSVISDAAKQAGREPADIRIIVRGVLNLTDTALDDVAARRPLHGTASQIRDDFSRLAEIGVTELFIDLNFDPEIGNAESDPAISMSRARHVLETFAPLNA
jgi:probable F420-dependent oxidoreductase